jgi:mannose-1-phosphate guanylyltransferase/mannose-6-phosphate isomerase
MKSIVEKPWGSYQVLEEGTHYTVKKLIVNSGGKLSLQNHQHRSEHWIIVEGEAEVTINDEIKILKENETIFIPQESKHRLANKAAKKLTIIELWYGDILDENDIERFEDIYERI